MKLFKSIFLSGLLAILLVPALVQPGIAQETVSKVLILPFKINAAQDLTYIQEGIQDMLSTRLAQAGRVQILAKSTARQAFTEAQGVVDQKIARSLGQKYGADYVIYGSLTMIGQSLSLDASIIGLLEEKPFITVHTQSEGMDALIPKVNSFAEDINLKVFKRSPDQTQTAAPPAARPAEPEAVPVYRRHPDSLLVLSEGAETGGSLSGEGFWRSPAIPEAISGLDVADVDGDGRNEIVYCSKHQVTVVRLENRIFRKIATYEGSVSENFFTLDAADINRNGRAEIFVNNQSSDRVKSMVLEWKDNRLEPIVKDKSWIYRIVNLPSGPALFGQQSTIAEFFFGRIKKLTARGGGYEPDTVQPQLKKDLNVLSFSLARFTGETNDTLVAIDINEELRLYTMGSAPLWEGDDLFGGSPLYTKISNTDPLGSYGILRYYYIPPRILTVDADGDKYQDILISQTRRSSASGIAPALRPLTGGSVHALTFDQLALKEKWRSPNLSGYPVDYQVKDYNNDGQTELIIAVLYNTGEGAFSRGRSIIVAYSLEAVRRAAK